MEHHCCGRTYTEKNYSRHITTQTHQRWLHRQIEDLANTQVNRRQLEMYKNQLVIANNSVTQINAIADDLYQKIKDIRDIKIQKQFGDKENIISLNVRIEKGETVEEYKDNLRIFEEVLKKVSRMHKISLSCKAKFIKYANGDEKYHNLQSNTHTILTPNQNKTVLNTCFSSLEKQIEERYFEGSGLSLASILNMDLHIYMIKPKRGRCYANLPFKTKAVINVRNDDNKCFLWSILAALHPPVNDSVSRVSSYLNYQHTIKIDSFPVDIRDIPKIERDNNLSINVFECVSNCGKTHKDCKHTNEGNIADYQLEPLFISSRESRVESLESREIDILLYSGHYMYLKNIGLFFRTDNNQSHKHICKRCLSSFVKEETLVKHKSKCEQHDYCKVRFPKNNTLSYTKHNFRNRMPFTIYADFESISESISEGGKQGKHQKAAAVGLYLHSEIPELIQSEYFHHRGKDVVDVFCNWVENMERRFQAIFAIDKPMIITPEEEYQFSKEENCYYCSRYLGNDRVRDHDHLTGKFRAAAHSKCNLLARKDTFLPIFFHNLSHYDAHLFIKQLANRPKQVEVLAKNAEEYISFSYGCFRFLDSYRFLQGSLDNITKSMTDEDFKILRAFYPNYDTFKLLRHKGSVPYSFYDSHESFQQTSLTHEMFFNDLKNVMEPLSVYQKAKEIWDHFKCQNHGQFIDVYLQSDVLLLADAFEKFRNVNLNYFAIDPCHCYSAPGLSWCAGLKYTDIKLELLTDVDMLLFFETAIRGGISGVMGTRYVKADENHKLLYIDANNLYGWAMMESLPYKDFRMYQIPYPLEKEDILRLPDDGEIGYFLEVDLDYPSCIKDVSKHFPFCPERMFIKDCELSEYQKSLLTDKCGRTEKLMLTQKNKRNYIVHYRMLKFYLTHGMILRGVHNLVSFKQNKWLKPYIEVNTNRRIQSTTDFEKDYHKLLNNSYFGKTCESVRNRMDVKLVSDKNKALELHSKTNFSSETIFDQSLTAILMRRNSVKFDKPIYIGAAVLELSKLLMYQMYYDVLMPYFGVENMELLYMDTDSFVLKLKTSDLRCDLYNLRGHFDYSNYPKDHSLYDTSKTKVPGYFKDELAGKEMKEFIALRSKMYAYKTDESETKKLKGINKNVVDKDMSFSDFYDSLFNCKVFSHKVRNLVSVKHEMYLKEQDKVSLNPFDDKRYILNDGITTLPFG